MQATYRYDDWSGTMVYYSLPIITMYTMWRWSMGNLSEENRFFFRFPVLKSESKFRWPHTPNGTVTQPLFLWKIVQSHIFSERWSPAVFTTNKDLSISKIASEKIHSFSSEKRFFPLEYTVLLHDFWWRFSRVHDSWKPPDYICYSEAAMESLHAENYQR